jgi:acyl transferase domain-containing protein/thioesterase domain-containing protein
VVGHSQGEIAAATVAGILSLDDGARVVVARSKALAGLGIRGGLLSVVMPVEAMLEVLAGFPDLSVAAVNSPAATVVAGSPEDLDALELALSKRRVLRWRVPATADFVAHSARVETIRSALVDALGGIRPADGAVPFYSTARGGWLFGAELDAEYWYANVREPVRFADAVLALAQDGYRTFIEVSAQPVLSSAVTETAEAAGLPTPIAAGTLRREDGGAAGLLASLAEVHVHGAPVDWTAVLGGGRTVELPTYAFQRRHYWPKTGPSSGEGASDLGLDPVGHPLLGASLELAADGSRLLTGRLSQRTHPWLADHVVHGTVILPGTAFVELALVGGYQCDCLRIEDLSLEAPLVLPAKGAVHVQVSVGPADEQGRRAVEIHSRPARDETEPPWTRHASGLLAPARPGGSADEDFAQWPPAGAEPVGIAGFYEAAAAGGYALGPAFHGLRAVWRRGGDVYAEVELPTDAAEEAGRFGLHPALFDAAQQAGIFVAGAGEGETWLSFGWNGVSLEATGAKSLRVLLRRDEDGGYSLTGVDATGARVIAVDSLLMRRATVDQTPANGGAGGPSDALFAVDWPALPGVVAGPVGRVRWALLGGCTDLDGGDDLAAALAAAGVDVRVHPDLPALVEAVEAGELLPDLVLAPIRGVVPEIGDVAGSARALTVGVLDLVQRWLVEDRLGPARLAVVTRGAVAALPGEGVADPAAATVWGLVRSAQSENPDRLLLLDLPAAALDGAGAAAIAAGETVVAALGAAERQSEPELAVRAGTVRARRLGRPVTGLARPDEAGPWHLAHGADGLELAPYPQAAEPLASGQVRIAVRAAGITPADLAAAAAAATTAIAGQGTESEPAATLGRQIAGVVVETGPRPNGLSVGDRVFGFADGGFGPLVVARARHLARIPAAWSFAAAATVPTAYTAAWHLLDEVADARPGQRVLIHHADRPAGLAAAIVARRIGCEVYATVSAGTDVANRLLFLERGHLASARPEEFEASFADVAMDLVLDAPDGAAAEASARLTAPGGRALSLPTGRERLDAAERERALRRVTELLSRIQCPPPAHAWDVRRAPEVFRAAAEGPLAGPIALTVPADPAAPRPAGTTLITGGTGTLGALVAERLVRTGRTADLVLTSRSGPAAPGAALLAARLAGLGAQATIVSCDAADLPALAGLLDAIPAGRPLTSVVHTAGVLDDGVVGSLTPERIDAVLAPKASSAWNLHLLTRGLDLESFVLFSSAAATLGAPGQGNYAAANGFLDALAAHRRAGGLPAVSLTWGLWEDASTMTGHLDEGERGRIGSSGVGTLSAEDGLALLEAALGRDEALLAPIRLSIPTLRAVARAGRLPACLRALAPVPRAVREAASASAGPALRERLVRATEAEQVRLLTDLVRSEAAAVLGHSSPEAVVVDVTFLEQGFDSLTAVELRNRLNAITGLRLTGAMAFDHPTPAELAPHLRERLAAAGVLTGPDQEAAPAAGTAPRETRRYIAAGEPAAASGAPAAPTAFAASGAGTGALGALYLAAAEQGRAGELMQLVRGLAAFRPRFEGAAGLATIPAATTAARAEHGPALICFPSFAGTSDAQEFARLAAGFRGRRAVSVVPTPGYLPGEPLAADVGALLEVCEQVVRATLTPGRPAVFLGYSSGGLIAHLLAARLAGTDAAPAALVLLDTFLPEDEGVPAEILAALPGAVLANNAEQQNVGGDAWLTALAHYYALDWRNPPHTGVPTLLLRAAEPIPGADPALHTPSSWDRSSRLTVLDVPGDHFSILRDQAGAAAAAVDAWLETEQGGWS